MPTNSTLQVGMIDNDVVDLATPDATDGTDPDNDGLDIGWVTSSEGRHGPMTHHFSGVDERRRTFHGYHGPGLHLDGTDKALKMDKR